MLVNTIDEQVLVIGAGPSGTDLANEISKTAKNVTWSHHLKATPRIVFSDNVDQKPDVSYLTEDGAIFTDGSFKSYSVVFYCTGYKYKFPFLSIDCNINCEENYVFPLYKHCLNINRPTMGFIGLSPKVAPNQMFDLQVRFCLKFMSKLKELPSKEEMEEDTTWEMHERWSRGITKRTAHVMGTNIQDKYYADLSVIAEIEPIKPVIIMLYNQSRRNQVNDGNNYRKVTFCVVDDVTFSSSVLTQ